MTVRDDPPSAAIDPSWSTDSAGVRVAIDGALVPPGRACVSVFDRGFLYGDAVFETLRTYRGELFAAEEHVERLAWSAAQLGFRLPLPENALLGELTSFARVQSPRAGENYVRLTVTRGEGPLGLLPPEGLRPTRVLLVAPLVRPPASIYRRGVDVVMHRTFRPSDAARGAKVTSYLESLLALRAARERGAHEALIVSADGSILEGATSNLFCIRAGGVTTPPLSHGILPGITRKFAMDAARSLGLRVVEERLDEEALATADEAFLTSTLREIVPIARVEGRLVSSAPGVLTRRIHQAFRLRFDLPEPAPWEP